MNKIKKISRISLVLLVVMMLGGCSIVLQKRHSSDVQRIQELKKEARTLFEAKKILENKLKTEIGEEQVHLKLEERGLVITFVAEVLFDSGKTEIKKGAYPALNKVVSVLVKELSGRDIGIEGHTDNEPIKYSGWKSNWELSTARATSVLHYLVDEKGVRPERVSATGYGEYRPVVTNDTPKGRQQNRRVEVIIMPKKIERVILEDLKGQKAKTKKIYKK